MPSIQQTTRFLGLEKNWEAGCSPGLAWDAVLFTRFEEFFTEFGFLKIGEELFDLLFGSEMRAGEGVVVDYISDETPLVTKHTLIPCYKRPFLPCKLYDVPVFRSSIIDVFVFVRLFDDFLVNLFGIKLTDLT